jgi:hypothetical protein
MRANCDPMSEIRSGLEMHPSLHILNCTVQQKGDPPTRASPDIYSFYYLNNISESDKLKDLIGDSYCIKWLLFSVSRILPTCLSVFT